MMSNPNQRLQFRRGEDTSVKFYYNIYVKKKFYSRNVVSHEPKDEQKLHLWLEAGVGIVKFCVHICRLLYPRVRSFIMSSQRGEGGTQYPISSSSMLQIGQYP